MDITVIKQNLLNNLYTPYKKCPICPIESPGSSNVVFGEGNPNANLMVIGEAPGREEDRLGRPFVGRSGRLLTQTLHNLGVKRDEIFITNVLKCRPPNNRTPFPQEIEAATKLLLLPQIKIIDPQIILTVGAVPLRALFGQQAKISQMRGTLQQYNGKMIIPTYHPAYILRNPKALGDFQNDIKFAVDKLK